MTFKDLDSQEKDRIASSKGTNQFITISMGIYFSVLLLILLFKGGFNLIETIINLIISFIFIYWSYRLKDRMINITITNRAFDLFKLDYVDIEFEKVIEEIEVEVIKGIGYIFKYEDKKIIYTSIDNDFKEYIVQ